MFLPRWLHPKRTPSARTPARRPRFRLAVKGLEERLVMTAGFVDPSFAGDGVQTTVVGVDGNAAAYAAAVYPGATPTADGQVVVAGEAAIRISGSGADFGFALVGYNPDGTLDAGFGKSGVVLTNFTSGSDAALAVRLVGGKVLAGGYAQSGFALARYTAAGTLDSTFGNKGTVVTQVNHGGLGQAMDVDATGRWPFNQTVAWSWPSTKRCSG